MENASNALLIAGGVLIGVLILSLAVYLFADFGSTSADINQRTTEQQLTQFNSKFTVYESSDYKWTIYDIVTVAGYAHENNKYYTDNMTEAEANSADFNNNYKITVKLKGSQIFTIKTENIQDYMADEYNSMIHDEVTKNTVLPKYNCDISYHDNGRVSTITFNCNT
jgi:hypothetical protein